MSEDMRLYWQLYFEKLSNEKIIRQNNPLREYEEEIIEGPIIDIGCGQSPFLLGFSSSDRLIYAIDNEQIQLDFLKERVLQQKSFKLENWHFNKLNFPNESIPENIYSLIILSNLLHFFSLPECIEIGKNIIKYTTAGSLIYVAVHSYKFYANNPNNKENNSYFKHYFTIEDLECIFTKNEFERVYIADVEKKDSVEDKNFLNLWLNEIIKLYKVPANEIEIFKGNYLKDKSQSDLIAVFKRL